MDFNLDSLNLRTPPPLCDACATPNGDKPPWLLRNTSSPTTTAYQAPDSGLYETQDVDFFYLDDIAEPNPDIGSPAPGPGFVSSRNVMIDLDYVNRELARQISITDPESPRGSRSPSIILSENDIDHAAEYSRAGWLKIAGNIMAVSSCGLPLLSLAIIPHLAPLTKNQLTAVIISLQFIFTISLARLPQLRLDTVLVGSSAYTAVLVTFLASPASNHRHLLID